MKKIFVVLLIFGILVFGCEKKAGQKNDLSVLVFITGIIAGSPPYELLAEGAAEFAAFNPSVNIKIYEAGRNQAEWQNQLAEMISGGEYDIVIGSNPSLPEICANIAENFPKVKFIITDAHYEGHPQIATYLYNQYEQSLFLGYLAALVTTSNMPHSNSQKKIGFIAAQEYPLLTRQMIPGFLYGARLVDPAIELDRRITGSWADASKAADLASAMIDSGVDVLTAIAGDPGQVIIKTASEKGAYIVWYNTNAYSLAPGTVLGCGIMEQKKLVIEILNSVVNGSMQYGVSQVLGVKEGYINFLFDDPHYQAGLPASIRQRFEAFMNDLAEDRISYIIPAL